MSNPTVRGVDPATLASLKPIAGKDLDSLVGAWSADEAAEFEAATAALREIEPEFWG